MTRFFYLILPLVAMLAFAGYYFGVFHKAELEKQHAKEVATAQKKAEEAAKKKIDEEKAARDAKQRADEKRKQEDDKRAERERRQKEEDDKLRDETAKAETRANKLGKDHADLEIQLVEIRRTREAEQHKAFDMLREVELAKVDRRNAELELQLDTEKIASRVDASSMVQMPIFPKPPAGEKNTEKPQ